MAISVGIVGVTGYTGQELLKILLRHPEVSVEYLASRRLEKSCPVGSLLPAFRGVGQLHVHPFKLSDAARKCDLLFLALPHGVAMELAPKILRSSSTIRIIDLSGDFRLHSAKTFQAAYRIRHTATSFLKEAAYGLSEWEREPIRSARLVANPGCYATAALLGLAPLAKAGLLAKEGLIVDAKSGVSGAGRSAKEELLFCEVNEDLRAYKVNAHQHIPEMEQELHRVGGRSIAMTFVPHLVPMNRGIYATIYAPLTRRVTGTQLRATFEKQYDDEPFIRILTEKSWPQVKSVTGTNMSEIGLQLSENGRQAIVIVALDNLVKGASGQAVQNMNLMFGFEETAALQESP